MISKSCDRCERMIEVDDDQAGKKLECPFCGDTNIMPVVQTGGSDTTPGRQHPEDLGLPPDSGPEKLVIMVRPALIRSRPLSFAGALILTVVGLVLAAVHLISPQTVSTWIAILAGLAFIGGGALILWWWIGTLSSALEITNKRTVAKRGLLSRSTSEVVHDNIRNVQVDQSFWERVWGVGTIGISSSGQDGIEIQMRKIPRPRDLHRTIDLYRPLD